MHSVAVGFERHLVVVEAEDERVIDRVRRSFRQLLVTGPSDSVEVIRLQPSVGGYELTLDGEQVFEHADIGEVVRLLRHEIIGSFVRRRPDLLWLHAGATVRDGKAVLFVGPYGRGKSTLVTQLCLRGWRYASDDIVPVNLATQHILAFPLTPIVREDIGEEPPHERLTELRKIRISLPDSAFHRDPVPIGAVVLPCYRIGVGARLEPYSPAAVALDIVREGINAEENAAATVALCARLVDQVPVMPITFSDPEAAADLVEARLQATERRALSR